MLSQFPLFLLFTRNARFVGFGFFLALTSSFGQTFYVALFNGVLATDLGLSTSELGSLYGLATFTGAVLLIVFGRLIDVWDLRLFTAFGIVLLSLACVMFANAAGPFSLLIAILGLRLAGQGLMSHTGLTSMSRYFESERGLAVSIASVGFAAGVALFPFTGALLLNVFDWRQIWTGGALVILLFGLPFALLLLRGHTQRHKAYLDRQEELNNDDFEQTQMGWTRAQVLRDTRFYMLLPVMLALPFIATGIQFHQILLVEEKGWVLATFASGYLIAAMFNVVGGLGLGTVTTRLGSIARLIPWFIAPLGFSMILLMGFDTPLIIWPYMIFNGSTGGMFGIAQNVLWAELYGTRHLGAVRSMVTSASIFAAALAPAVMGWLLDAGWTMRLIAAASLVYIVGAMALASRVRISARRPPVPKFAHSSGAT